MRNWLKYLLIGAVLAVVYFGLMYGAKQVLTDCSRRGWIEKNFLPAPSEGWNPLAPPHKRVC